MANLIAAKTAAENSADVTVTTTPVTISLLYADASAPDIRRVQIFIDRKDTAGNYQLAYTLHGEENSVVISGPGVYRVRKPVTNKAIGIDQF